MVADGAAKRIGVDAVLRGERARLAKGGVGGGVIGDERVIEIEDECGDDRHTCDLRTQHSANAPVHATRRTPAACSAMSMRGAGMNPNTSTPTVAMPSAAPIGRPAPTRSSDAAGVTNMARTTPM